MNRAHAIIARPLRNIETLTARMMGSASVSIAVPCTTIVGVHICARTIVDRTSVLKSFSPFFSIIAGRGSPTKDNEVVRADLTEVIERHEVGLDAARPDAVARRRKTGQRTARENIEELCAIPERSSSTGRLWLRRSGGGARSTT